MPRISAFHGIVISMFFDERPHAGRPHFHATRAGDDVTIDIVSLQVLAGGVAPSGFRLLRKWTLIHREELMDNWERARLHEPLSPVDPLP